MKNKWMKNFIVILLLVITSFTNFVNAQNDSLTKKFKSIKTYTLGDRFEKKGWTPKFDDFGKAICYLDRISLGNFKDVELNIYLNDDGTIYKLNAEGMSCGSSMDKSKTFRLDIQEYYGIEFKLLPVKPSSPYKLPVNGGQYGKDVKYIYVADKNGVKYTLTTINSGMGVSPSKISMFFWKVSFSMTEMDLEKRKNEQDKIKTLKEQNKAKSNF